MTNNRIQSLVAVQAIKDYLLIEQPDNAESLKADIVSLVKKLNTAKGEKLSLKSLDSQLFKNQFIPFITEMDYALDLEIEPVKSIFYALVESKA